MANIKHINNIVKGLIALPDKAEFYCDIELLDSVDNKKAGIFAIVSHTENDHKESCVLIMETSEEPSMPPIVVLTLPVCADLTYGIGQYSSKFHKNIADLLLTITLKDDSARLIFPETNNMNIAVNELKKWIDYAKEHPENSHGWIKTYTRFTLDDKKPLTRSTTFNPPHDKEPGVLRYVMPLQRAETINKINLRRNRTTITPKEPLISLDTARDHWINKQMMKKEDDFVEWKETTAFIGTWNVHGVAPNFSLTEWLQGTLNINETTIVDDPDFYVIGLQEMETNTEAYIRYDPTKENAWVNLILGSLRNNGREYYKVASKQLVTMLLIVIAKKSHSKHITNVSSTYAGVGLMNMMGNKGGIAIRFRFHDSYLCFVTSHLAAFVDKTEKRNQDFVELTKRLILPAYRDPKMNYISYHWNDGGDEGVAFMEHNNVLKNWTMESSIFHSDILVWCGDLNYRIGMTESEIKNDIRRKNYERLLEYDQLSIERTAGRTFPMFDEGTITFNPTYKYDPGTDHYDSSPKRRAPSWTDRILWKRERAGMKSPLKLIDYDDCKSVCMSDHKPVRALMSFQIRTIDHKRQAKTHESLIQHSKENQDIQPRGTITSSYVKFNKIEFLDFQQQRITLENTGQVLIVFKFIPRQDETAILPPWLNVYPLSGVLAPGESVLIQFEIFVDQTCSTPLNQMEEVMETILILRLENARDLFVEVSAEYVPTCFGTYLEKLPSMTIPLDDDVIDNFLSATSPTTTVPEEKEDALQIQLPACLWKILNFLWNPNMMQIESLFLGHGNLKHSSDIREWLDNDKQMAGDLSLIGPSSDKGDTSSIHSDMTDLTLTEEKKSADIAASANSMIDILIFFLEFLPEPVITSDRYKAVINASSYTDAIDMLRNTLPPCHKNVLFYVVLFLRQVIDRAPESCYKSRKEAIVERFTVLLKPPADYKEHNPKVAKEKRERFICQLIDSITYDESVH